MSELYSVIQLLATLAIGFVILGYSEFFTETLRTRFFHADDTISDAGRECLSNLPDDETLDNLEATDVGKGDTGEQIEELKRKCKEMKDNKIPDFEKQSKTDLKKTCDLRSLAAMSLFVFMASTLMLFIPTLKRLYGEIVTLSILPFSALCIVYLALGWIFGEKDVKRKAFRFGSMKHPIAGFALIFALSIGLAFLALRLSVGIGQSWKYMFVSLHIAGWLNFVMFAFVIRRTVRGFKEAVSKSKQPLLDECKSLMDECNKLRAVSEVAEIVSTKQDRKRLPANPTPPNDPE